MTIDPNEISLNIPDTDMPRVVMVGGGFGGIEFAKKLGQDVQLVMIDKHNYHTFQPLLYQVAAAALEPDSIASPLRKIFKKRKNFYFRMANVNQVLPAENMIDTSIGKLRYDVLVLATGSKTNFFGNKELTEKSFQLKAVPQALDLRSQILQNFERAVEVKDARLQDALIDYVVVGGGPTGVELAGALSELKKHVLPNDFPELDLSLMNIYLLEGGPKLLGTMSEHSSKKALEYLTKMGVEVRLNTIVQSYDGNIVQLKDGSTIASATLIWAAGVTGNLTPGLDEQCAFKNNRIRVNEFNRVVCHDNIYALGDIAAMTGEKFPNGHPMVAPVAMQQGKHLAQNLNLHFKNQPMKPFSYFDKGTMATVGRNKAVVDLPGNTIKFGGFVAWLAWMFVHLMYLIGFRSKLVVMLNWIYGYFTYDKGTRLIVRPFIRAVNPTTPEPIPATVADSELKGG